MASPFLRAALPGAVHEDVAHRLGRGAEEMLAIVPALLSVAGELQPCLMDECCRLQGLAGSFVRHLAAASRRSSS